MLSGSDKGLFPSIHSQRGLEPCAAMYLFTKGGNDKLLKSACSSVDVNTYSSV